MQAELSITSEINPVLNNFHDADKMEG
jgi:hypothetical protein